MGWIYHWRDVWEQPGGAGRGTRGRLGADQEVAALPGGQLPVTPGPDLIWPAAEGDQLEPLSP